MERPEVRVLASRGRAEATLLLQVDSTPQTAPCHRGGRELDRFHGFDQPRRLRHLPVWGREGFMESRPKRSRGPFWEGGPTTTQRGAWYDPHRPHTTAFEQEVWKQLVHRTVADVSRQFDLGVKAVEGLMDHRLAPTVDWGAFTALETVGLDEVARRQGHGQSVAVMWARDAQGRTSVLTVWPDRLHAMVQAFRETSPQDWKATVQRVCIDMGEGDAGAVAAALPKAPLVVDRVHVAVQDREAVDERRTQECRRLNAERPADQALPTAEWRRWGRREWPSRTPAQPGPLRELFEQTPTLVSAYRWRTPLTAILEGTPDRATAQTRLRRWGAQVQAAGLPCCDTCLNTVHPWQDGLLHSVDGRHTSGFVEGLNNTLKRLKRRCFGLEDPVELLRRLGRAIEGPRLWT